MYIALVDIEFIIIFNLCLNVVMIICIGKELEMCI